MSKKAIIEMLRADMRGEHQAIIQYLNHAYSLEWAGVASSIEAIAREEMRHLDWLAKAIVALGGDPDLVRDEPDLGAAGPGEQMLKDVALEQQSIDQYRAHMEAIEDPELLRLLARIVHDELVHQDQFRDLAEKVAAAMAEPSEPAPERLEAILNAGVEHEYTVILQYLYHGWVSPDCEEQKQLEDAAINEMQHMGWLAEGLQEEGTQASFAHHPPFISRDPIANLEADVDIEDEVTRMYSTQAPEVGSEELKSLIQRIRDHEIYHADVFRSLLRQARARKEGQGCACACSEQTQSEGQAAPAEGTPPAPSIGGLKK
ncbi:MAG: ferritin-like domain-containing protein [Anaerolineae bacterium]|jgi:bacterioferritin|nr:ferritin-like domain-containing protein [Chloroflexota bacterium]